MSDGYLKISDFGLSIANDNQMKTRAGTPNYVPPEAYFKNCVTFKGDLWAMGLILYEMHTRGQIFYDGKAERDIVHQISKKNVEYPANVSDLFQLY